MEKKRILLVTQELDPYTAISQISELAAKMPKFLQDNGFELRILMPRYGTINERRHRLHEVVRLSGMNIIVDNDDYPLIIKVASLPGSRLQVYFLDNDEFFRRKSVFADEDGKVYDDNPERAIFFCKGAIETVKKFGWAPDIVACHGWMTSLLPSYIRTAYKTEPLFEQAQIVYSVYDSPEAAYGETVFYNKAMINKLSTDSLEVYGQGAEFSMHRGAIHFSDAVIEGSENMGALVDDAMGADIKPVLRWNGAETHLKEMVTFYETLIVEQEA
jgi:starch synthase